MPKCDFNKVVKQLYWNRTFTLQHIFRTSFLKNNSGRLLLHLGLKFSLCFISYKTIKFGKKTNFLSSRTLACDICATSTFTRITNTISTTIWWCGVITFSFTILNSTSTCLWTCRIWWPVSKLSINAY